jgi:hypothetical protein
MKLQKTSKKKATNMNGTSKFSTLVLRPNSKKGETFSTPQQLKSIKKRISQLIGKTKPIFAT